MPIYNFDSTGTSLDNRISPELHTVNSVSLGYNNYLVPRLKPFFEAGFSIIDKVTGLPLEPGTDYVFTHKYQEAIDNLNMDVYGSVTLVDENRTGTFVLIYQTLGGNFVSDDVGLIQSGLEAMAKLTTVDLADIENLPTTFPLTPHNHPYTGIEAVEQLLGEVILMRQAMENPNTELMVSDIIDLKPEFITPVINNLEDIANALISKAGEANIAYELATFGSTDTTLVDMIDGEWTNSSLSVQCKVQGTYMIDMSVLTDLDTTTGIKLNSQWIINGHKIDRSGVNRCPVGLAKDDVVQLQLRVEGGNVAALTISNDIFSSSLMITRLGN